MICQFCNQDVPNPCHDKHQVRERAANRVERCEHALKDQHGMGSRDLSGNVKGGGRH